MNTRFLKYCLLATTVFSIQIKAQHIHDFKKLDSLVHALDEHHKAMGQITIADNGKPVYNNAWGYKQIIGEEKKNADVNTKYRVGSISKMFTAVMILQLVEEGKLTLDTKLSNFFPQLKNASEITIQQLLNHHSGLHNFTDDSTYLAYYTRAQTRKQMLELFQQQEPNFEPGSKGSYSNTNFLLLGYIIEDLTKQPYKEALKKRITDKIGLKNTYAGSKIDASKNEAFSYSYNGNSWEKEPETDMSIPLGAGNIISTTNDLTKFITALFQYKLINKTSVDKMTTLTDNYGLGIFQFPFYERRAYGHTGGIDAFESFLGYFPDDSVSIAFIGNGLNYRINDIALGALNIYYDKPYDIPSFNQYQISTDALKNYEGIYASQQVPLKITITLDGDHLSAQATGQSSFPLDAVSASQFKFDPAGIVIDFTISDGKPVGKFYLKQGGGSYLFEKE